MAKVDTADTSYNLIGSGMGFFKQKIKNMKKIDGSC